MLRGCLIILAVFSTLGSANRTRSALQRIKEFKVSNGHETCEVQFNYFVKSLDENVKWANDSKSTSKVLANKFWSKVFSVFSSFANFDKTYSRGNSYDFGDFDRCLAVNHFSDNETVGVIKGKYCLVQYYPTRHEVEEIPPGKPFNFSYLLPLTFHESQLWVTTTGDGSI